MTGNNAKQKQSGRQATEGGAPALIRYQQREQLDQATGGEILDGKPDTTGKRSKKLLRAMRRKQRAQMRQAIEDAIPGDTPAEDTDGQQKAGQ